MDKSRVPGPRLPAGGPSFWVLWILLTLLFFFPKDGSAYSRIISLKPNITEIIFALGQGNKLVGATTYCNKPKAAANIPRVADYVRVDLEKTLQLNPDLILTSRENSSRKEIYFLKERGIPVEILSFKTLGETYRSIERLGKILQKKDQAKNIIADMKKSLDNLKKASQDHQAPRALLVVGYDPLVVVGGNNFIDETTHYLALANVAGKSRMPYPTYSIEKLLRTAPEVIVELPMGSEDTPEKRKERKKWWQRFSSIPAVRSGRIYSYQVEKIRAVPDLPVALAELFSKIHGKQKNPNL